MRNLTLAVAAGIGCATTALAAPLRTTFTYQGQRDDKGALANANCVDAGSGDACARESATGHGHRQSDAASR